MNCKHVHIFHQLTVVVKVREKKIILFSLLVFRKRDEISPILSIYLWSGGIAIKAMLYTIGLLTPAKFYTCTIPAFEIEIIK